MAENLTSKNFENDEHNLSSAEIDYKNLITRLKEIKTTIALLENTIFR